MHLLKVGEPYNPRVRRWPEGANYNFRAGAHELLMFFPAPTAQETKDVAHGAAQFALHYEDDILFFLYRFGTSIEWSDAPYSYHLVTADERRLPEPLESAETRALLSIILIDARTGINRAMRALTLSAAFTRELHARITEQAASTWMGPQAHEAALNRLYSRYPTTRHLLDVASVRTEGGM